VIQVGPPVIDAISGGKGSDAEVTTSTEPELERDLGINGGVAAAGEWEAEEQLHAVDDGLGDLFASQAPEEVISCYGDPPPPHRIKMLS
jgi:hypothetical protein